jgi:hypothetical protein
MKFVEDDFLYEGEGVDTLMYPHEVDHLALIARSGRAVDPDDIAVDLRGCTEAEEEDFINRLVNDIYHSRLFERGYFVFSRPKYYYDRDMWVIEADLTNLGWDAYKMHKQGVFWDVHLGSPAFDQSYEHYERLMLETTFRQAEDVYKTILGLPHRIYDSLRYRIPTARERVWREVLSESCNPTDPMWDTLRWSTLDGLERLKKQQVPLHVAAYERAVRRANSTDNFLLQPLSIRAIPSDPAYDSVRTAAQERMVELWIKRVQAITSPDDRLFQKVESLGEEFHLVKAEAFLQKMKCWTPLDQHGRRS